MNAESVCGACPRHCRLADGALGFCRARRAEGGRVVAANYGHVTSLALDPIEKKPIAEEWWHFTLANEPYPDTYFDFPVR